MSATEILLHEASEGGNSLEVVAIGSADPDKDVLIVSLYVRTTFDVGKTLSTKFEIDQAVSTAFTVPWKLLQSSGRFYRLIDANGAQQPGGDELAALKDRIRRRLADPIAITENNGLFRIATVGSAALKGRVWLNPGLVDGFKTLPRDAWALRAEGEASIDFDYSNDAVPLHFHGRFLAAFSINSSAFSDWITADFGFALPQLPGFDLRLPKIRLPTLEFPALTDFPDLPPSPFALSPPPFVKNITFAWTKNPKLKVQLDNGRLTIATEETGEGAFSFNGQEWVKFRKVTLAHAGSLFAFNAQMDVHAGLPFDLGDISIVSDDLPFVVFLSKNAITPRIEDLALGSGEILANANFTFAFSSGRIAICEHNPDVEKSKPKDQLEEADFKVLLALALDVTMAYEPGRGQVSTELTSLRILEPYPVELIMRGAAALGDLIRVVAAIPLPSAGLPHVDGSGVARLLERLGEMLAAAARWIARQANAAAGVLAGLAEAVFDTLVRVVEALGALGKTILSHVAVEVRLEPRTYRLRQLAIMPVGEDNLLDQSIELSALGFDFSLNAKLRPALMIDFGPDGWFGLVVQPAAGTQAVLGTDLWLDKDTGPQQAMGSTDKNGMSEGGGRLIQLKVGPMAPAGGTLRDIVVVAMQNGRPLMFQTFVSPAGKTFAERLTFGGKDAVAIRDVGTLQDAGIFYEGKTFPNGAEAAFELSLKTGDLKGRLLSLLGKTADSETSNSADGFFETLKQKVEIKDTTWTFDGDARAIKADIEVIVHIDDDFAPTTVLSIAASARDLSMKITGGDRIDIYSKDEKPVTYHPLGLDLTVAPKVPKTIYKQFYIDLAHGGESFGLGEEAKALLGYGKVSTSGKGLQFEVPIFEVGRSGIDLEARILPEPVTLGGVDVPFRFTSGAVAIKGSRFGGGSLAGSGQLPQQLVGEANASIALQLGAGAGGGVVVKGATARLDKSGDPIRCTSTRFELTITELGFDFVDAGSYHFYFLLTGTAVFRPGGSEFASGLLKHFKDVTIKLDKAPLAADARALINSISFQVKVDPPKKMSFFNIFDFELRGFGFHPSAPKFGGDAAMSISGQVNFTSGADKVSPNFEFHSMWIAAPKPGSAKPRIRFDGLTLGLKTGAVDIEGTAIAVDGAMPDLYRPDVLPKDVTAEGFLASGRLDIDGWASMSAAMGFLELRKKDVASKPKHSFFLYGQMEKLAEPIDTPVGRIYLREFGFGFGYRYTLAGIAQAETAASPQELVRILDDVSKYQGSLNTFKAWEPTYDNDDMTLALRGMFALSAASERGADYDEKREAELPNPLLFDIVAAFRTDLTFLINLRAWVSVNYNDWVSAGANAAWKANPTMRGYLYFSVPRKEFLGRFIADGKGYVGTHPKLPEPVMTALRNSQFSATLYIRPGLFHAELGWPYELRFSFGKPGDNFYMNVEGGLIHRIEDLAVLNGIAFRATGAVHLEGRVGGSSLGAAAVAHAAFAIEARVLSYLSLKDFGDSFYYGYLRIDVAVAVRVDVWLRFKVFNHRITLSASFSLHLALSIALEAVIGPNLIGGRANVSIGVRALGRSLSVSIGFSFNNDNLAVARARVARFMELGLSAPIPDKAQDGQRIERNPRPDPPRGETAKQGDQALEDVAGAEPLPVTPSEEAEAEAEFPGRAITATDFWAFLHPTRTPAGTSSAQKWYVMQLLPRDHTPLDLGSDPWEDGGRLKKSTFFASPKLDHLNPGFTAPGHQLVFGDFTVDGDAHLASIGFGREDAVAIVPKSSVIFPMQLDAVVGKGDQPLTLGRLLQNLFLGTKSATDIGGALEEPEPREVETTLGALADDAKTAAEQLARAGRSRANLDGQLKREAEIEEARSAILSAVIETASAVALAGATSDGPWPARQPEIDARDFGLTFLVNDAALKILFEGDPATAPPKARFRIVKSDATAIDGDTSGHVRLFNHPHRMFRSAQPRFSPTHVIDAQGIKLNWDLEPAWGNSLGVYDDPEFHLKHYRIRRTIRGIPGSDYRADFVVKAAAPVLQAAEKGGKVSFLRPDFQFIDDLRLQDQPSEDPGVGISKNLRKLLLGELSSDEKKNDAKLKDLNVEGIDVLYEIVPVDNAGTSDFGQPYVVGSFSVFDPLPLSPREVTLQVAYDGMPTHVSPNQTGVAADDTLQAAKAPRIKLLIKPAGPEAWRQPDGCLHLLRIWSQPIAPSGSYGSDAVDQARRRPDQAAIDRQRTGIKDYVLSARRLDAPSDLPLATLVTEQVDVAGKVKVTFYAFSLHDVPKAGSVLGPPLPMSALADAIDAVNVPEAERQGYRVFLAAISGTPPKVTKDPWTAVDANRRGEWKTVAFNIAIDKRAPDPEPGRKGKTITVTAISSVVELLEQPVHYEFLPLERSDMRVESGRLIVLQPTVDGELSSLEADRGLTGLRDAMRRTATRLEWNANPKSLKTTEGQDCDNNTIAGFDLHCLDPDALPGRASTPEGRIREIVDNARPLGRVSLLAPQLRGLDPSGFGDFGRIESAYPSATLRQISASNGSRKAAWYTSAETTAIFPQPAIRRSIMPDPDEGLIAALFSGGKPDKIRVRIPAWDKDRPLPNWSLSDIGGDGWGEFGKTTADKNATWDVTFATEGGYTVAALRQLLQNIRLVPGPKGTVEAGRDEAAALQRRVGEPGYLSDVAVEIEAIRLRPDETTIVVAAQQHRFDLMPALHPVLGDALAFLQYDAQEGDLAKANGRIYRRYALAPDTNPEVAAKDFPSYLDEAPPERDPYGWGALRTLGLASGFRLFDTEIGDYVRFGNADDSLNARIRLAFARALARYPDRDNGQAFVDILTQPWGNVQLAWFDGGHRAPQGAEEMSRVRDEMLAVVQIALRPHPDRMVAARAEAGDYPVRYYALVADDSVAMREDVWTLTATEFDKARYDVLTVGRTLVSQKPVRLTRETPSTDLHENRPVVRLTAKSTARVLAVVREIRLVSDPGNGSIFPGDPLLTVGGAAGWKWEAIRQPAVQNAADAAADLAFGRFEGLAGEDWGDAIFRPAGIGRNPVPCLAMDRLGFYAARRFAAIQIPVTVGDQPEAAEIAQSRRARGQLADRIVRFWSRYLEHCAPAWGWAVEGPKLAKNDRAIFFSLGTIADPGHWRRAPGSSGTVSVTIVDAERRGARRKYAVRPYGRYETWSQAAPDKIGGPATSLRCFTHKVPQGLYGVFPAADVDTIARTYFIDATLPRTEPLEKPVILSAVTQEGAGGRDGRMELVVAHGSDMVLAQANRRNAALLAPLDISVGYWREFAHMPWADRLRTRHELDLEPMQGFGSLDQRLNQTRLTIDREEAETRLANLRQRVPDAWLGSTMISAAALPYFFRVHALVHATAGIVVSDQVAATFEEGFYRLEWPNVPWPTETGKPTWPGREIGEPPRYAVARHWIAEEKREVTVITFELSALRFVDCLYEQDARLWFGDKADLWKDGLKRAAHLPEPGVSYRIAIETPFTPVDGAAAEILSRAPQIEVLPRPPGQDGEAPLYILQQSGARLTPKLASDQSAATAVPKVFGTDPEPDAKAFRWKIPVRTQLVQEPAPLVQLIGSADFRPLIAAILGHQTITYPELAPAIAALHELRISWTSALDPGALLKAIAVLSISDAPEGEAALRPFADTPTTEGSATLLIPPVAAASADVEAALTALMGRKPDYGAVKYITLRRPLTNAERDLFAPNGSDVATDLATWIACLADDHLFGAGRRPAAFAFKGTRPPIRAGFEPKGKV